MSSTVVLTLSFETESLAEFGTQLIGQSVSSGGLPISALVAVQSQMCIAKPGFFPPKIHGFIV